jgi:hypothetical protein
VSSWTLKVFSLNTSMHRICAKKTFAVDEEKIMEGLA